jgi:hypothetical protein
MSWTSTRRAGAIASLSFGLCLITVFAAEGRAEEVTTGDILAEGDALAEDGKYEEAILKYKEAFDYLVPRVRKLEFKEPVRPRLMTRGELRDYMLAEFQQEYTPAEWKLTDRGLKALGFVPADTDVRETMLNLLTEEVGGFYNPRSKELFLIREEPRKKRSVLTRFLSGPEFDPEGQRIVLSHEMTHALADQHFDLLALDKLATGNDDMLLAIASLVEGEATLVMMSEMLDGEAGSDVTSLPPERIDFVFNVMNFMMPMVGGRAVRTSPPIFYKTMVFPYHKGCVFVLELANRDGWDAVNQAFRDPPLSTEQIMHSDKYVHRDYPTAIDLPQFSDILGDKWTFVGANTLGELQTAVLLEMAPDAGEAAAGWDGDRYAVYENDEGKLGLAWFTTWDSADDAREFAYTYSYFASTYWLKEEAKTAKTAASALQEAARRRAPLPHGGVLHIGVRDSDVVVLLGFSDDETDRLLPELLASQKAPLTARR